MRALIACPETSPVRKKPALSVPKGGLRGISDRCQTNIVNFSKLSRRHFKANVYFLLSIVSKLSQVCAGMRATGSTPPRPSGW